MARTVKMTFTLDDATAVRIGRTAEQLGIPKSGVVREAVAEYAARAGRLGDGERVHLLKLFDAAMARLPRQPTAAAADREIAALRKARRQGGRGGTPKPRASK